MYGMLAFTLGLFGVVGFFSAIAEGTTKDFFFIFGGGGLVLTTIIWGFAQNNREEPLAPRPVMSNKGRYHEEIGFLLALAKYVPEAENDARRIHYWMKYKHLPIDDKFIWEIRNYHLKNTNLTYFARTANQIYQ